MENLNFKFFLESKNEFDKDINSTLKKIPKKHRDLIKHYNIKIEKWNTLNKDSESVGEIDEKNTKITMAAPWNFSREMVFLHEIGHAVWKYLMTKNLITEWNNLLKKEKNNNKQAQKDLNQIPEEIFCMIYAQKFVNNPIKQYDYKKLIKFIDKVS
jgi:hypothetical protein